MGKKSKHIKPNDQDKPWAKRHSTVRQEKNERSIKNTFLIYCEGKNTEPTYFKSFPVTTDTEVKAIGLGRSKTALVQKVLELTESIEKDAEQQIWIVFDRDIKYDNVSQGNQDFNEAIQLAQQNNLKCAYSNDCFELWFVLHDELMESALHRTQLYKKLSTKLNCNYEKDGKSIDFAKSLYAISLPNIENATRNAQKLHQVHGDAAYHEQNPCTTVYQLVEELNNVIRK